MQSEEKLVFTNQDYSQIWTAHLHIILTFGVL